MEIHFAELINGFVNGFMLIKSSISYKLCDSRLSYYLSKSRDKCAVCDKQPFKHGHFVYCSIDERAAPVDFTRFKSESK